MAGHEIDLRNLKQCFEFLEWFKGDIDMQGKVAVELAKRCNTSYNHISYTGRLPDYLIEFLKNVSSFYHKLVNKVIAGNYGGKSAKDVTDALLECLPKFLAALYYIWYNVDVSFDAVGGGKWRGLYVGWENTWWGWGNDYGGGLQEYLRWAGSFQLELIPGGFGPGEVTYGYEDYTGNAYTLGKDMIDDLTNILNKKGGNNNFRDVFVTTVKSNAGTHKASTGNAIALVETFCNIVKSEGGTDGGDLKKVLDEDLKKNKKCINWNELKSHCAILKEQLNKIFKNDGFSYTGQSLEIGALNAENFARETAKWFRANLPKVRQHVGKIDKDMPVDDTTYVNELQKFATNNIFPYGFIFGNTRYGTMSGAYKTLTDHWRNVFDMLGRNGNGLAKLKTILEGEGCEAAKTLRPVAAAKPAAAKPAPARLPVAQGSRDQHNTVHHIVLRGTRAKGGGGDPQLPDHQSQGAQQPSSHVSPDSKTVRSPNENYGQSDGNSTVLQSETTLAPAIFGKDGAPGLQGPTEKKADKGLVGANSPGSKDSHAVQTQLTVETQHKSPSAYSPSRTPSSTAGPTSPNGLAADNGAGSRVNGAPATESIPSPIAESTQPSNVPPPGAPSSGVCGSTNGRGTSDQVSTSGTTQQNGQGTSQSSTNVATTTSDNSGGGGGGAGGGGGSGQSAVHPELQKRLTAYEKILEAKKVQGDKNMENIITTLNRNLETIQHNEIQQNVQNNRQKQLLANIWSSNQPLNQNTVNYPGGRHMKWRQPYAIKNISRSHQAFDPFQALVLDGGEVRNKSSADMYVKQRQDDLERHHEEEKKANNKRHKDKMSRLQSQQELDKSRATTLRDKHEQYVINTMRSLEQAEKDAEVLRSAYHGQPVPDPTDFILMKQETANMRRAYKEEEEKQRERDRELKNVLDRARKMNVPQHKPQPIHKPPPLVELDGHAPAFVNQLEGNTVTSSPKSNGNVSALQRIDPLNPESTFSGSPAPDPEMGSSPIPKVYLDPLPPINLQVAEAYQPLKIRDRFEIEFHVPNRTLQDTPYDIDIDAPPPPSSLQLLEPIGPATPAVNVDIVPFDAAPHSIPEDFDKNDINRPDLKMCIAPWMKQAETGDSTDIPETELFPADAPRTVRDMLQWLAGLRNPKHHETLKLCIKRGFGGLQDDPSQLALSVNGSYIIPQHVLDTIHLTAMFACSVLTAIAPKWRENASSKTVKHKSSDEPDCCALLCQLRDYVYACHYQLEFLKAQCNRDKLSGGWKNYEYGSDITSTTSPLHAFLTDDWDSTFETHPFDPCNLCLKSRVRMGFRKGDLPKVQQTGSTLSSILTPSCGGDDPLLTLASYLNCLTRRTQCSPFHIAPHNQPIKPELNPSSVPFVVLSRPCIVLQAITCFSNEPTYLNGASQTHGIRNSSIMHIIIQDTSSPCHQQRKMNFTDN